jgi:pimeloyl-ACP methyl ester carboxylesterase
MTRVNIIKKTFILCLALAVCGNAKALSEPQALALITSDHMTIHAQLSMPDSDAKKHPTVILIHQGGSNLHEWDFIVPSLLSMNYIVLAYDIRGHGKSSPVTDIYALFDDPKLAPKDLLAVLDYLKKQQYVDSSKIAVVGASVGANLAGVAIANMQVKTAVAISAKTIAVQNLAASQQLDLHSVFYISSNESDGKRALWAQELYSLTTSPRRLSIERGSQAHGVAIFKDKPELQQEMLEWLKLTL